MKHLLTFNCHEPYLHCLAKVGYEIDAIDGLPGRVVSSWDEQARPIPKNIKLISLNDISNHQNYVAGIAHNITDLLALRDIDIPKILVFHVNLEARINEGGANITQDRVSRDIAKYLNYIGGIVVSVSHSKLASWNIPGHVILPPVDPCEYDCYTGELPIGLRVSNQVSLRNKLLCWNVHDAIVKGFEWHLVGYNPDMEGVGPAKDWEHLKDLFKTHRYYIHTAREGLEDGYNLALLEAMCTGMPIVSTFCENSPVEDGVSGFVSNDIDYLRSGIRSLIADRELAIKMGMKARLTAIEKFPLEQFITKWQAAIGEACRRYNTITK